MRFIISNGKSKRLLIIPAQVLGSMDEFHTKAGYASKDYTSDEDAEGQEYFSYRFLHNTGEGADNFFGIAKISRRKCSDKYTPFEKYAGPKGVEAFLTFRQQHKPNALDFLEELMTSLKVQETGKKEEREIKNILAIDQWYKQNYDELSGIAKNVDDTLKNMKLPKRQTGE